MILIDEDCLSLIFEELNCDKNSLYSCLLVNRLWCKTVVPILWRDPWKFLDGPNILKNFARDKSFLNTFLLHLSEESKNYLKVQGVDNFLSIPQHKKPLFNYISYIKFIRQKYKNLDIGIIYIPFFYDNNVKSLLEREIYKLLIGECIALKFLDITEVKHPLYKYPGAETSLSCLYELHCKSYDDPKLFHGLAKICRLIEKICVFYINPNHGLAELIKTQQNLKYIKILAERNAGFANYSDNLMVWENKYQMVDQAIIKHAHNLIYLDMPVELTFYNNILPKLINLQKLMLDGSSIHDLRLEKQLTFSAYPRLKVLHLDGVLFVTAKKIIQSTEGSLQIIWADNIRFNTVDQSRNFTQIIYQNCPDLKYVKILLKGQYLEEIEQLLINCQHLEALYIDADYNYSNRGGDELLGILIKSAPKSLFKIQLNCFEFKAKNFNLFFIEWRCRKPLWLYLININVKLGDDFKVVFEDLIEKYKKEGIVEKYESRECLNFINDDYKEFR